MWKGGPNEITRDVIVDGQPMVEVLPTNEAAFQDFRCFVKEDAEMLIRYAIRGVQPPALPAK